MTTFEILVIEKCTTVQGSVSQYRMACSLVILFKFQLIGVINYKFVLGMNKLNIIKVINKQK